MQRISIARAPQALGNALCPAPLRRLAFQLRSTFLLRSGALGVGLFAAACSGDGATIIQLPDNPAGAGGEPTGSAVDTGGTGGTAGTGESGGTGGTAPAEEGPAYVVSTLVFGAEGTLGYVSVLDSLEPQTIDDTQAREFSGTADTWVNDGFVYVTSDESFTITKYAITDGELVEQGRISFAQYGLGSFGFWLNTFVSPTKAYYLNDTLEYIVWNPTTMEIVGTVPLPEPEEREGFRLFTAYSDRAAVLKDGRLYQPFYYTDESYFLYSQDSRITVLNVETDTFETSLNAPCPGLDYATVDGDGNMYFSSWVYAAGGAAVLEQPSTCVFEVPATGEPRVAFDFATVTGGHEGAAMRYVGNGHALLSVLHEERFPEGETDASLLTFSDNWRFWSYDMATGTATPIEAIDWNAGAQYSFDIDQKTYMLVATSDYAATTVYDIGDGETLTPVFDTRGWATRLFKVR